MASHWSSQFFSWSVSALLRKSRGPWKPRIAIRRSLGPLPEGERWSNSSFWRSTVNTVSASVARSRGPKERLSRK